MGTDPKEVATALEQCETALDLLREATRAVADRLAEIKKMIRAKP